ncbi:CynX/NimT family MFS transporter [Ensifer sp. 4252]|uniref:MFS transporter n=1 Tax=Ensifer sp. 4252 TaxID=3373915 RepID=UPI003D1E0A07
MSAVVAFVPERTSWIAVTAVVAAGMVAAMQVGKGLIAGPLLQADLGLDLTALGWLTSVFAIVGVVGGMPAGAMVAAIGDRRMLGVGMGTLVLGIMIGAASPNFTLLILSRIFEGFGFLLVVVAGPAILMRIVASARRDLVFALWSCFMPAGMAIAMLSGSLFASWQTIWWINGLVALLSLLTVIAAVSPSQVRPRASAGGLLADMTATLTSRGPVLLFVLFALYSLMTFTLFSFLPILLVARMNVSLGTAGVLSALITLANVIGNLAAGTMLSRGVGRGRLVIAAATLMGASGLWIFLSQSGDTVTSALCVLFSAIGGLIPATLISTVPMLSPRPALAPMAMGLLMQGSNLGQLVGPVAVGTAIEAYGWTSGAAFIGAGALFCTLLATTLDRVLRTRVEEKA